MLLESIWNCTGNGNDKLDGQSYITTKFSINQTKSKSTVLDSNHIRVGRTCIGNLNNYFELFKEDHQEYYMGGRLVLSPSEISQSKTFHARYLMIFLRKLILQRLLCQSYFLSKSFKVIFIQFFSYIHANMTCKLINKECSHSG